MALASLIAAASRATSSAGILSRWKAIRCADFGPMPGQPAELVDQRLDGWGVGARHSGRPARRAADPGKASASRSSVVGTVPGAASTRSSRSMSSSSARRPAPRRAGAAVVLVTSSMRTARPVAACHAASTSARALSHLSRWARVRRGERRRCRRSPRSSVDGHEHGLGDAPERRADLAPLGGQVARRQRARRPARGSAARPAVRLPPARARSTARGRGAGPVASAAAARWPARRAPCVRVVGSTGAAGGRGRPPVGHAPARGRCTRAASGPMSSPATASGTLVSCTRATSTSTRGSGAWRSSTRISPSRSMARTRRGRAERAGPARPARRPAATAAARAPAP